MDLLEVFRESADLIRYPAGSIVFGEGAKAEFMYVIMEGEITLSLHGHTIAVVSPGAIFGEMALLDSKVRSATSTAASDCVLVPIDIHSFKSLIQYTPDFALHVMNVLAQRLRRANEALTGHITNEGAQ